VSRLEIWTGFESTFQPAHDRDVMESTDHDAQRDSDLDLVVAAGVRHLRYPIRWHRVETSPDRYDWAATDAALDAVRRRGLQPVVDLVHHTSYPRWLTDGFADRRFAPHYLAFVEECFARYPWIERYTLFNEPFSTLFLAGHEGIWPPRRRGMPGFVELCGRVLPALTEASRLARRLVPAAEHVWVDTGEHHTGSGSAGKRYAALANDRRFFVLDAFLGRLQQGSARPFVDAVTAAGGGELFDLEPGSVDVVGLDYYAHNQWHFGRTRGAPNTPRPRPLDQLLAEYATRYGRPVAITETNLRGAPSDRATWFRYVLDRAERALSTGVDVRAVTWFPFVDSTDWDSLLTRCDGHIDPVGVCTIDRHGRRTATSLTRSFTAAAHGAPAADLPAYQLQRPVDRWLRGYRDQVDGWQWQRPPTDEVDDE
jgi:beta-glucosidase/6-phospho-beta-glucosidase/beta-galactosidase